MFTWKVRDYPSWGTVPSSPVREPGEPMESESVHEGSVICKGICRRKRCFCEISVFMNLRYNTILHSWKPYAKFVFKGMFQLWVPWKMGWTLQHHLKFLECWTPILRCFDRGENWFLEHLPKVNSSPPEKSIYHFPIRKACLPTAIFHGYIKLPGCKVSFSIFFTNESSVALEGQKTPPIALPPDPFFPRFKSRETQRVQVLHDSTHAIVGVINLQGGSILRRILMIHSAVVVEVAASFLVGFSRQF